MNDAIEIFTRRYPAYATTAALDTLRSHDFTALTHSREIYLDYTGSGLYGDSQLAAHVAMLQKAVYGNPHSDNPSSLRSTELMEQARAAVLAFFNAPPEEYSVIFTANASAALRLIGESYPFKSRGRFLQLMDNHNSVTGIREFARRAGTPIHIVKNQSNLRVDPEDLEVALRNYDTAPHLFAYPAQSNFSGTQYSLDWIKQAQDEDWDVLLDAAAFVPTNRLDLNQVHPDFTTLSFYKMFGWPTGVGCLIARKKALAKLRRPWFSGGSIWALSVQGDWHVMAPDHEAFEDGTVNFLNLPAVTIGLNYLKKIGIDTIHTRVMCLTDWALSQLKQLKHANGQALIELYGPDTSTNRGATIAFNFLGPEGRIVDERIVSREAKKRKISLRTGCFCNPGSGEAAFNLPPEKLKAGKSDSPQSFDSYLLFLGLQSGGAIRISFGLVSNFSDAQAFLEFARSCQNAHFGTGGLPERGHC